MAYLDQEDELQKMKFNLKSWKKLLPFIKPYYKSMIFYALLNVLCAVPDILYPLFSRYAIDNFISAGNSDGIVGFTVSYVSLIIFQTITVLMFLRIANRMEMLLGRDLKRGAFVHLQELSFSYYNQTPVGYMMARVTSDTSRIGGILSWAGMQLVWAVTYVIGVFAVMFSLNWKIALIILAMTPFVVLVTIFFQKRILLANRKMRQINSEMTGAFNEGITGAKTSKTLVIEDKNTEGFKEITSKMYAQSIRAVRLQAIYNPVTMFIASFALAVVIVNGGNGILTGVLELGILSAFITYAIGIFEPIMQIIGVISEFNAAQVNVERVTHLLEQKPIITDRDDVIEKYGDSFHPKKENWESIKGDIEFKDLWFKYPDGSENIYENFNLKIEAGKTVAIVGETGAGKSTLVNIACRFFEPTEGYVLIDGVDYRERSQLWLHSNLGYVLQNPHLFSGSVKENIRYGRLDATDEEIIEAAKLVSAHDIIMDMEDGYETLVGESGDRLSTGEKQLISFARAILADPRIFVLDEATSSIDTKTEELIQNAVSHILQGRTSFLIAHRLSTIRHADLILLVHDGKVVERGTHEELLRKKGKYYHLYKNQYEEEASQKILG